MELVYIWINKTQNTFVENCDMVFNRNYKITYNQQENKLNINENEKTYNLFSNAVIVNITALVGNNGSGKSTVLKHLYESNNLLSIGNLEKKESNIGEFYKTIQIYLDEETLFIYYNIKNLQVAAVNVKYELNYQNGDTDHFSNEFKQDEKKLSSITKVFISNAIDLNSLHHLGLTKDSIPETLKLNNDAINGYAKAFYSNNNKLEINANRWCKDLNNVLNLSMSEINFQAICDTIFFNRICRNKNEEIFKIINTDLTLFFRNSISIFKKYFQEQNKTGIKDADLEAYFKKKELNIKDFILFDGTKENKIISILIFNLIFEMFFLERFDDANIEELKQITEIQSVIMMVNETKSEYYINALDEIILLKNIFDRYPECCFERELIKISSKYSEASSSSIYLDLTNFIKEWVYNDSQSFILKYIDIRVLNLSSGERAFLNFFSWLGMINFFKKINPQNPVGEIKTNTKENILLLIDEIDLYCHPEWQRNFIFNMITVLTNEFSNKKIQIIFTTHSPIVLSDIPNDSVLYMKDGQLEDRTAKTFAQNIYALFNDAFYLKNPIGKFAESKLEEVGTILKTNDNNELEEKLEDCKKIVNMIGEPVLRSFYSSKINKIEEKFQSQKLKAVIADFEQLDKSEQASLIQYIIKTKGVHNK